MLINDFSGVFFPYQQLSYNTFLTVASLTLRICEGAVFARF